MRYRSRDVEIEAHQFHRDCGLGHRHYEGEPECPGWLSEAVERGLIDQPGLAYFDSRFVLYTELEGGYRDRRYLAPGDFIIRQPDGGLVAMRQETFEQLFAPKEEGKAA